jgi:hypothetical protein
MPDAKTLRKTCANHRVFRRNRLVAMIVFMVVGVRRIVRCRYPYSRYRSRQEISSSRIHQAPLPPLHLRTTVAGQLITKRALLPDSSSYICSRSEMSSCVRNPPPVDDKTAHVEITSFAAD